MMLGIGGLRKCASRFANWHALGHYRRKLFFASPEAVKEYQDLLETLSRPLNDDEARTLCRVLPITEDSCFGLAWTLIHFVESAPGWPLTDCFAGRTEPWHRELLDRAGRSPRRQ